LPRDWRLGQDSAPQLPPLTWKNKTLASLANMAVVKFHIARLSRGQRPDPKVSPLRALILQQIATAFRTRQYRRWIAQRSRRRYRSPPPPRLSRPCIVRLLTPNPQAPEWAHLLAPQVVVSVSFSTSPSGDFRCDGPNALSILLALGMSFEARCVDALGAVGTTRSARSALGVG